MEEEWQRKLEEEKLERKLSVIRDAIQSQRAFRDAQIELRKGMTFYKFWIDPEERHPCLIVFTRECLLNQNEDKIIGALEREVFGNMSNASEPMEFFITESREGICVRRQS